MPKMPTIIRCCGGFNLRRRPRQTWIQRVSRRFGYAPWECVKCQRVRLLRAG